MKRKLKFKATSEFTKTVDVPEDMDDDWIKGKMLNRVSTPAISCDDWIVRNVLDALIDKMLHADHLYKTFDIECGELADEDEKVDFDFDDDLFLF